jgi:hypothetical protein
VGRPDIDFEQKVIVHEKPLSQEEELVYQKYQRDEDLKRGRSQEYQRDLMDKFNSIYSSKEIADNKNMLSTKKTGHSDLHSRGEIFEYLILETEKFGWFGENCFIAGSSKFDDVENKTDVIIEWEDENNKIVRLAIDCTVVEDFSLLEKKIKGIGEKLKTGELSSLKYHLSELTDERVAYSQIPQVVLAVYQSDIAELCKKYTRVINKDKGSNDIFSQCETQVLMLEEIKEQLERQSEKLLKIINIVPKGKVNYFASGLNNIRAVLVKIDNLIEEKEKSLGQRQVQGAIEILDSSGFKRVVYDNLIAA